jgi:hypothetical protein
MSLLARHEWSSKEFSPARSRRKQQKETLHPHEAPQRPGIGRRCGVDLFMCHDRNYLVTVDYYAGFWEVYLLEDTKSKTVIRKHKAQFALSAVVMRAWRLFCSSRRFDVLSFLISLFLIYLGSYKYGIIIY